MRVGARTCAAAEQGVERSRVGGHARSPGLGFGDGLADSKWGGIWWRSGQWRSTRGATAPVRTGTPISRSSTSRGGAAGQTVAQNMATREHNKNR